GRSGNHEAEAHICTYSGPAAVMRPTLGRKQRGGCWRVAADEPSSGGGGGTAKSDPEAGKPGVVESVGRSPRPARPAASGSAGIPYGHPAEPCVHARALQSRSKPPRSEGFAGGRGRTQDNSEAESAARAGAVQSGDSGSGVGRSPIGARAHEAGPRADAGPL